MRPQLAATVDDDTPRESRKVKTVAAILEVDQSQVRRLVDDGELEAHTQGKCGVRVYLDSVADYQRRQARKAKRQPETQATGQRRSQASTTAHRAALASLRADGCL